MNWKVEIKDFLSRENGKKKGNKIEVEKIKKNKFVVWKVSNVKVRYW